jgi:methionyl-tRNA synthetase
MLLALDIPLPRTVFAHGYLNVGGQKMSKTRLTGISPHELIAKFGSDGYRYYFMRDINFGLDGSFSWEAMLARYNSDLANDLGNLAARVLSMIERYVGGEIPSPPDESEVADIDADLIATFETALADMSAAVDSIAPHDALKTAWAFVRKANAYVEATAPWTLARDEEMGRRLEVVLYRLADALRLIALILYPIIPRAAQELWRRVGLDGQVEARTFPSDAEWGLLPAGARIDVGDALFPRLEEDAEA